MKVRNLLLVVCCLFASLHVMATEDVKDVDKKWEEKDNGDRSIISTPFFSQEGNVIYIHTGKTLENLSIEIADASGCIHYTDVVTIPAGTAYPVWIDELPEGTYYITIRQGSNYMVGLFSK